jgi:hypothetical protein
LGNCPFASPWLRHCGIPKSDDWLNSELIEIWLDKLRAPRNLSDRIPRSRNLTYWTPSLKKSDWARPEYRMHLIGRRCCILLSALLFDLRFLMFFRPLSLAHRCFFDLWTLLMDVFSTFERCSWMFFRSLVVDVFLTLTRTDKLFFFHMTLLSVEGIISSMKTFNRW